MSEVHVSLAERCYRWLYARDPRSAEFLQRTGRMFVSMLGVVWMYLRDVSGWCWEHLVVRVLWTAVLVPLVSAVGRFLRSLGWWVWRWLRRAWSLILRFVGFVLFVCGAVLGRLLIPVVYVTPALLGMWAFVTFFPYDDPESDVAMVLFVVCMGVAAWVIRGLWKARHRWEPWLKMQRRFRVRTRRTQETVPIATPTEAQVNKQKEDAVRALVEDLRR